MLCESHAYPTIPARDLARARKFYEESLGFEPMEVHSDGVFYDANHSLFFLYQSGYAGTNQATACSFDVKDIKSAVQELRAKGVRFEEYDMPQIRTVEGIASYEGGSSAWFKDSEGNILALNQPVNEVHWPGETVGSGQGMQH
jgi:catechol 2,3-dioxygenase-like lactoylglutathione lyase family enzyme